MITQFIGVVSKSLEIDTIIDFGGRIIRLNSDYALSHFIGGGGGGVCLKVAKIDAIIDLVGGSYNMVISQVRQEVV